MTVVEPSVSTLESFLTSTLRLAMRWAATDSAMVSVGSRPSGTLATMMPIANTTAASVSMPTKILLIAKKKMPRLTAMTEMSARQPRDVLLQRRESLGHVLGQPRDLAELSAHAGRVDHRAAGAEHRGAAGEDEALDVGDRRRVGTHDIGAADDRVDLAGERRVVDAQLRRVDQARIRRDEVALLDDHEVAGDQGARIDLVHLPVADHLGLGREHVPERLDGLLGAVLLDEREDRVDQDDDDDRDAQGGLVGGECEHGCDPQQNREHVDEMRTEPHPHGLGLLGGQHVLAELGEPLVGLLLREALARRAEQVVCPLGG